MKDRQFNTQPPDWREELSGFRLQSLPYIGTLAVKRAGACSKRWGVVRALTGVMAIFEMKSHFPTHSPTFTTRNTAPIIAHCTLLHIA